MIVRRFRTTPALSLILFLGAITPLFAQENAPTYTRTIGPLLTRSCVSCHRAGGAAPFSLTTYAEARRRADQIAQVTHSGYMPPWLTTTPGFCNERRLTDAEKSDIAQWAKSGAPEGQPQSGVSAPVTTVPDWPLGKPDVVLKMTKPFLLPSNALDTTRCFVLPNPLKKDVSLRAIVFRPTNPTVIRYASLYSDKQGVGRKLQSLSGAVGYFGFTGGIFPAPMGSLWDWSPGSAEVAYPQGVGAFLPKGTDLILQVRFHPSGKQEQEQMQVGLYFSKESAREQVTVRLGKAPLYLPKNSLATLTDTFVLPVDTRLLEIVPNGHITARTLQVTADLPDGKTLALLEIPDWNVDWKQPYRLLTPLALPAGTQLTLKMAFDNTDANPRNPAKPTHRIVPGIEFAEEMSSVWLRLVSGSDADRLKLTAALPNDRHEPTITIEEHDPPEGRRPPPPRPGPPVPPPTAP